MSAGDPIGATDAAARARYAEAMRRLWYLERLLPVVIVGGVALAAPALPAWLVWVVTLGLVPAVSALALLASRRIRVSAGLSAVSQNLQPLWKRSMRVYLGTVVLIAACIVTMGILGVLLVPVCALFAARGRKILPGEHQISDADLPEAAQRVLATWPGHLLYVYPDAAFPGPALTAAGSIHVSRSLLEGDPDALCAAVAHEVAHHHLQFRLMRAVGAAEVAVVGLVGLAAGALIGGLPAPWLFLPVTHQPYAQYAAATVFGLLLGRVTIPPFFNVYRRGVERRTDALAMQMVGTGSGLAALMRPYAIAAGETVPPPRLYYLLRYQHPTYAERLRAAESFADCAPRLPAPTGRSTPPSPRSSWNPAAMIIVGTVVLVTGVLVIPYINQAPAQAGAAPGFASEITQLQAHAAFPVHRLGPVPSSYHPMYLDWGGGRSVTIAITNHGPGGEPVLITETENGVAPVPPSVSLDGVQWSVAGGHWYHSYADGVQLELTGSPAAMRALAASISRSS